jgi:hypothetical protein
MEKEFVPYELALRMKALGFDEPCFGVYDPDSTFHEIRSIYSISFLNNIEDRVLAPTFSQAFRWFREKYDLRIWIESNYGVAKFEYVIATTNPNFIDKQFNDLSAYKTYEKAELACLDKLLEIVENK